MNVSADVQVVDECAAPTVDTSRARSVLATLPSDAAVRELATVFGLLADPARLRLLVALRSDELCVCDLAAVSGQSPSATSHALRLLRAHRVVQVRRVGRRAYYRLDDRHVEGLLELALAHLQHVVLGDRLADLGGRG